MKITNLFTNLVFTSSLQNQDIMGQLHQLHLIYAMKPTGKKKKPLHCDRALFEFFLENILSAHFDVNPNRSWNEENMVHILELPISL